MWSTLGSSSGGGYMSTSGFGESPSATQGRSDENRRDTNVVPTSVSGLLKGIQADDSVVIGQEKVTMVMLIGVITSVNVESTMVTIKIDDTTGPQLTVKQWLDQQGRPQRDISELMKPLVENCYVKVTGTVRSTNGVVYVVAHRIKSLSHLNELTSHLLEIAVIKKLLETGIKPSGNLGGTGMQPATSFSNQYGANGNVAPFHGGNETISGLTVQQQAVFQMIRNYDDENGCSIEYLMSNVKGMSLDAIRQKQFYYEFQFYFKARIQKKAVALLSDEGHIYSTIDDDHFKTTDN